MPSYRFSCWAKTKDLASPGAFHPHRHRHGRRGTRQLTFLRRRGRKPSSDDWKLLEVVFNSLDETEVNLYAGLWGGGTGTLWIDDLNLEALGLVNVLRRDGCVFAHPSRRRPTAAPSS